MGKYSKKINAYVTDTLFRSGEAMPHEYGAQAEGAESPSDEEAPRQKKKKTSSRGAAKAPQVRKLIVCL